MAQYKTANKHSIALASSLKYLNRIWHIVNKHISGSVNARIGKSGKASQRRVATRSWRYGVA